MNFFNSQNVPQRGGTAILFFDDSKGNFRLMRKNRSGTQVEPISPLDWIRSREYIVYYDYLNAEHPCNYSLEETIEGNIRKYTFTLNKVNITTPGLEGVYWDLASAAFKESSYVDSLGYTRKGLISPIWKIKLTVTRESYTYETISFQEAYANTPLSPYYYSEGADSYYSQAGPGTYIHKTDEGGSFTTRIWPSDFTYFQKNFIPQPTDPISYRDIVALTCRYSNQNLRPNAWFITDTDLGSGNQAIVILRGYNGNVPFSTSLTGTPTLNGDILIVNKDSQDGVRFMRRNDIKFSAYPTTKELFLIEPNE